MMRRREFLAALAASPVLRGSPRTLEAGRTIAVTVDDLPAARRSFLPSTLEDFASYRLKNKKFIDSFVKRSTPLTGFVSEGFMPRKWAREDLAALLEDWLEAGAELGNHSFSHPDLYNTTLPKYEADIVLGEATLGSVLAKRGRRPRYFRHPFLHTRKNGQDSHELDQYLKGAGYKTAPVTIDAQDWLFAEIYAWALSRGDDVRRDVAARAYLEYMAALFDHFEKASRDAFGREPAQVLLMHASALNFEFVDDVLGLMARRGYRFVSLDEALTDPVYQEDVPPRGSWIHGWREVRKLAKVPDPAPGEFLGSLFEDYRLVKTSAPGAAAPVTKRICDPI